VRGGQNNHELAAVDYGRSSKLRIEHESTATCDILIFPDQLQDSFPVKLGLNHAPFPNANGPVFVVRKARNA